MTRSYIDMPSRGVSGSRGSTVFLQKDHISLLVPEGGQLIHHVGLEPSDHDLILEQQVQLVGVLTARDRRNAAYPAISRVMYTPATWGMQQHVDRGAIGDKRPLTQGPRVYRVPEKLSC